MSFFEVKQTDWSLCQTGGGCGVAISPTGGVPEMPTWAMIASGFGLLGLVAYGRERRDPISVA